MSLLKIKNLVVKYGKYTAINNASFEAVSGEITGIIGANGGGKSSFINAVSGVLTFSGEIDFDGFVYSSAEESNKIKNTLV